MPGLVDGANGDAPQKATKLSKNQMRRAKKKAERNTVSDDHRDLNRLGD